MTHAVKRLGIPENQMWFKRVECKCCHGLLNNREVAYLTNTVEITPQGNDPMSDKDLLANGRRYGEGWFAADMFVKMPLRTWKDEFRIFRVISDGEFKPGFGAEMFTARRRRLAALLKKKSQEMPWCDDCFWEILDYATDTHLDGECEDGRLYVKGGYY